MLHDSHKTHPSKNNLDTDKKQNMSPYLNKIKSNEVGIKAVIDQSLQSYEKLPMLQIIFDKLVRLLSTSFRNLSAEAVGIEIKAFTSLRLSTWTNRTKSPSAIGVFKIAEWNSPGLISLDNSLVYNFIDILLGGKKNPPPKDLEVRPYTLIEQSIIRQILEVILNDLSNSFALIQKTTFSLDRIEVNPNLTSIARPGDAVIVLELMLDIDGRYGKAELVIPYETIDPIKKDLQQVFIGDNNKEDSSWRVKMHSVMESVSLPIEAVIIDETILFSAISKVKIGDTIILNHKAEDGIPILCGKKKIFNATLGKKDDQVAINITEIK
jgi:flagellar motor switch protein FliM